MRIFVKTRQGADHEVEAQAGDTVMEVIRNRLSESPFAICGGNCSCATCHVYVAPEWLSRLQPVTEDENDVLDGSNHRQSNSRLSCQVRLAPPLEGLRVEVAPEE